jgi:hypothetical protein
VAEADGILRHGLPEIGQTRLKQLDSFETPVERGEIRIAGGAQLF